jgi:hypothetical protein
MVTFKLPTRAQPQKILVWGRRSGFGEEDQFERIKN